MLIRNLSRRYVQNIIVFLSMEIIIEVCSLIETNHIASNSILMPPRFTSARVLYKIILPRPISSHDRHNVSNLADGMLKFGTRKTFIIF